MDSARERVRKALDALVYLPVEDVNIQCASTATAKAGERPACRVWDRGDLLRRLQSYKANTWFCKPPGAGPLDCARRGWVNTALDVLTCEFCAAKLHLPLPPSLSAEDVAQIGEGFVGRLASSHDSACPWRTVACNPGLEAFPPLERRTVCDLFLQRQQSISRLDVLPPVSHSACLALEASRRTRLQQLLLLGPQQLQKRPLEDVTLEQSRDTIPDLSNGHTASTSNGSELNGQASCAEQSSKGIACQGTDEHERRQCLLALTGWSAEVLKPDQAAKAASSGIKATAAALRCTMCNARAGLWNFVPEMAMASASKAAAGQGHASMARPVSLASVDLSRTIAGGDLMRPDSLPPSPGPFGSLSGAAPAFGAPSRAFSGSLGEAVQETRQQADLAKAAESGAKDPFGSAAAMAPAFAGVAAARQAKPATALQTSHGGSSSSTCAPISAPALGAPATSSADRGNPMPFGSPAGASISVFGIEALKTQSKRPRESLGPDPVSLDGAANKRLRVEGSAAAIAQPSADAGMASSTEFSGAQGSAARRPEPADQGAQANGASTPASQTFSLSTPNGTQSSSPGLKPPLPWPRPNSSRRDSFSPLKPGAFEPFDPLHSHRAFCPWVSPGGQAAGPKSSAGQIEGRVGWRWCLDSLIPAPGSEEEAGSGQPADQRTKLLALLRSFG